MTLVDQSGFDAFDAGVLADSWRQQPGTPGYGTDLTAVDMPAALASADAARAPRRRDLAAAVFAERAGDPRTNPDAKWGVQVSRILYLDPPPDLDSAALDSATQG